MDAFAGAIGVSDSDGKGTPVYSVCKPKGNYDTHYYSQVLRVMAISGFILSLAKGIRERSTDFRFETFTRQTLPVPPFEEQKAIVAFIRVKEKKITKFIHNKRRLTRLLKEQKQAIINQAVTRGINPDVKMKPSGVDWLGDVPEHWEVRKLKTIAKMKSGENITSMDIEENANYPVYGGNGIRGYCQNYTHEGLFLLVGRQGALCGNVHRVEGRFWASEHAVVTTVKKEFDIDWYYYLLIAMNLNQYSEAAAQPGISVEKIQNLKTIVPPIKEQEKIAGFINKESVRIDQTILYAKKEIELIQEYRTRLISDVVTGKVDVRDIKVEDITDEEITDDLDSSEDEQELDDSIEDILENE